MDVVDMWCKFGGPTLIRKNSKKIPKFFGPSKNGPNGIYKIGRCAQVGGPRAKNMLIMLMPHMGLHAIKFSEISINVVRRWFFSPVRALIGKIQA